MPGASLHTMKRFSLTLLLCLFVVLRRHPCGEHCCPQELTFNPWRDFWHVSRTGFVTSLRV